MHHSQAFLFHTWQWLLPLPYLTVSNLARVTTNPTPYCSTHGLLPLPKPYCSTHELLPLPKPYCSTPSKDYNHSHEFTVPHLEHGLLPLPQPYCSTPRKGYDHSPRTYCSAPGTWAATTPTTSLFHSWPGLLPLPRPHCSTPGTWDATTPTTKLFQNCSTSSLPSSGHVVIEI